MALLPVWLLLLPLLPLLPLLLLLLPLLLPLPCKCWEREMAEVEEVMLWTRP